MREGGHRLPNPVHVLLTTFSHEHTRLVTGLGDHEAPGIDDERATVTRAVHAVTTALRGGNHKGLAFDRSGPQQDFPMVLPGFGREGTRNDDPARVTLDQSAVQLRKSQVVANHRANAKALEFEGKQLSTSRVMVLLFRQSEEVPLVVALQVTGRGRTDEAVKVLLIVGNNQAAADRRITLDGISCIQATESPSIVSASSGASMLKPVVNISGSTIRSVGACRPSITVVKC